MSMKLNTHAYHAALGKAHANEVDRGDWQIPTDRTVDNSIGHNPDGSPAELFGYPVLKGGKVSAKAVGDAIVLSRKNGEDAITPALVKIDEAIKAQDGTANLSMYEAIGKLADRIDLARLAPLAKCPDCQSHDVTRMPAEGDHAGPVDQCVHCGKQWAMKPGTTTVFQYGNQFDSSEPDEEHESDQVSPAPIQPQDVAYDPDLELTDAFVNTPALPDGTPNANLHSEYARKIFGIATSA